MNKKILIVLEEIIQGIPSGVISVTENLIAGIYKKNNIYILTNKTHWISDKKDKFKFINKTKKVKFNLYTYSELNYFLQSKVFKIFFKIFLIPYRLLIFIYLIKYGYVFLKKNKIELVLNQSGGWPGGEMNLAISIASYLVKVKNILIIHNLSSYKKSFYSKFIYIRDSIYNITADKIITVSKSCRLNLYKNTSLKNIFIVKNGSHDFSKLKKIKIKKVKKRKFIIGYVGHIHERKGLETLLYSIKQTSNEIQFIIIGGGEKNYINKLKRIAHKNFIDILFVKLQKKTLNYYHYFDLFILPSKQFESFGLVLVEAMSCKKTIICSNYGGMKEIIINKKNGMLFKKNNSNDLKSKINYLRKNKKTSLMLSNNAKLTYHKLYTSKIMVENYKNYF